MKMRRVLALVMAVLMVIGLMPVVAADDGAPTTDVKQGKVTFTKTLSDERDNDGYYTLTISVSGEPYTVDTTPNADVVLVVDNSGSMATSVGDECNESKDNFEKEWTVLWWRYTCPECGARYSSSLTGFLWDSRPDYCTGQKGSQPRIDTAKEVGKTFANNILSTSGNKMSVIGFSHNNRYGGIDDDAIYVYEGLTNNSDAIVNKIDTMMADGGTNYTAAFEKAKNELLGSDGKLKDANRPAYVIFISDGAPGLRGESLDESAWNGSQQIKALNGAGVQIYTIGIALDEDADKYMENMATDLDHHKNLKVSGYETELASILNKWASEINSVPAGKDAKVIDYVNTEHFEIKEEDINKFSSTNGLSYDADEGKITWDVGDIPATDNAAVLSFRVKPRSELVDGIYHTNVAVKNKNITKDESCILSYTSGKTGNPETVYQSSPAITLTDREEKTYTVTYEFVSDDPNAALPYNVYKVLPSDNGKYKKDDEVEIAQEPADVPFFGYTWTFLRWEINGEKVDAGSTQKMPEGDLKIFGVWTRGVPEYGVTYEYKESANEPLPDEVKDTLPHDEYTYSANQEVSIKRPTPDSVTTSDGTVWTFEGWTLNGVSVSGSVQMDKELLSDDGVLAFVGTWKSEKADPTPDAPVVDVKVIVSCVNDPDRKDDKLYYVNPDNPGLYTVENNGVFEKNGTYKYVINLVNAYFVKQYSEALNIDHTLAENVEAKVTYTYDKESRLWTPDKEAVTINVVCRQDPTPEEKGILVEIRLNKNEGTWADNFEYDYKPMLYAPDNTTTKTVPTVKEDTFTGWYKGNEKVDLGSSLTYEEAIAIGKAYGIKSDNEKFISYTVVFDAKYEKVTPEPDYPPFIVLFPTLEISNKVIAPKNFEKTSFEYDIINVKTGDVEKSVTLKADSSVRVMVTGGTEYMVVPKNLDVPGYIVTTTSTPDSATVTSDKIGNVSVDFTHIYVVGLNTEDHYAYIRGYEDGTIRPEGNITRAEVATIFYRLLSSEALEAFKTTENTFTDVDSDAWYNLSVSTLAKAGVISGYPDGSFNPNGKITRAELVSIATRFFTTIEVGDSKFSDIAGHWAAKAIDEAYIKGIIKGYSDGTFRPDQAVTRAEAMKIVNGILGRPIDTCVLIEGIKLWPDVASDAWYYYVVAEATNAHRYELTTPEKWTAIIIDEIEY